MDARSSAIRMVAALSLVIIFPSVGFSGSVHIYGGDFNLPIPKTDSNDPYISKGWMADAVIEIPHGFTIADLDVRIDVTHTNVFDLQIFLQGPDDTKACLNMHPAFEKFFIGADYTQTVFDDEAELSIVDANAPFTGSFRPIDELSEFDGKDTYGCWRLQIYDAWDWDTGDLDRFELIFTVPEPASAILMTLAAGLLGLFKPRRGH